MASPPDDSGRRYWERHAGRYDRSMGLLGRPMGPMLARVGEAVRGADRVLEVAAGTGLVTAVLAREARAVVSTDYAEAMVERLAARVREAGWQNVFCERADLYALAHEPGTFDAVVAANVLHLLPDLPGALAALRRVLKPGGRLVVPTFCHDETAFSWALSRLLAVTGFPGQRRFTLSTLRRAVEASGLEVRQAEVIPGPIPIGYVDGVFPGE